MAWTITVWQDGWVVQGAQVSWKPLASPGLGVDSGADRTRIYRRAAASGACAPDIGDARCVGDAREAAIADHFFFLAMSQMMVKAGFLAGLMQLLAGLSPTAATSMVALFGTLSVPGGVECGRRHDLHAGYRNVARTLSTIAGGGTGDSAAGHAALGSLSIVMLIPGAQRRAREGDLVRFGFRAGLPQYGVGRVGCRVPGGWFG